MILNKKGRWRASRARYQLSFLIVMTANALLPSAQAGSIYQCKQADGRVAFQQIPCAHSDAQAQVGKTSATTPTAPSRESPAPSSASPATITLRSPVSPICAQTGRELFNPALTLAQTPPPKNISHSCKVKLPRELNQNELCIDACYLVWYDEFKKKFGPISGPAQSSPQTGAAR